MYKSLTAAFLISLTTVTAAFSDGHMVAGIQVVDGVLADANGMSLYTFDPDTAEASACNGPCAVAWPPLFAGADDADHDAFTIITRADGSRQWAHEGAPLYLWKNDVEPGDQTGDGVKGVWHLARP
ncbi:hypothetical protein [Halocynthiibacter sp.]|uniref:COG4315 family predicted lipoprotein n=1 Tax=Halocynthiibacter sp. TaxID=1979210 RepID=UPI003C3AD1FC